MKHIYEIGSYVFRIICPEEFTIPLNFGKFEIQEEQNMDFTYEVKMVEGLSAICDEKLAGAGILARRPDLLVLETEHGEARMISIKGSKKPYALYFETSESSAEIFFDTREAWGLNIDPVFTSLFALEKQMNALDSLIFHCAYICHEGEAILFSAPSETGKTTQANLWEKYRGVETVNGDRALLRRIDGRWHACGWPVCGTSEISENRNYPVRAIVMLAQSRDGNDVVRKLRPMEAFRLVYSQVTVNGWNQERVSRAMDLTEHLISNVDIYHLTCTISEHAVKVLEEELKNR